ncbi:MAG: DUF2892 domain-containing protein [Spirochaetota bacterium]|nr:DUF2892 domain-containing protein [Spirochaetota bacterium]
MKSNVHTVERIIRVLLGIAIIAVFFLKAEGWGISKWFGLVGIIPILTGSLGNCPLYSIFGFSTCKAKS